MSSPIAVDPRAHLRRDLQGLRGYGIALVIIGHLFLWPHGVFAALDIFFVISGYLITGILLAQLPQHGPKFFAVFYLGRVRRLMPVALLVLVVTVVATAVVYSTTRAQTVAIDAAWAAVFAVNWHFAQSGVDYFHPQSESPLLHYWSLSVEEQFYLGWPLLLLVVLVVARRHVRVALAGVIGVVVVAAFAYSMWHSVAHPFAAYFSTFDRVWEFGAGGLLIFLNRALERTPVRFRVAIAWAGSMALLVTIFALNPSMPFPAPWGLLPVLCTSAIVLGGVGGDLPKMRLLDNPVAVYVGTISYSLYLWHLPVNVLLEPFITPDTLGYYAAALALTIALGVASYHLVERPMRRARWLMLPVERAARPAPDRTPAQVAFRRRMTAWGTVAVLVAGSSAVVSLMHRQDPAVPDAGKTGPATGLAAQQQRITDALAAGSFPAFVPSLESLRSVNWAKQLASVGVCSDVDLRDLAACSFGAATASKTAVVVGDSVAASWVPAIRAALVPKGWRVQQLTLEQCGVWRLPSYLRLDGSAYPQCAERHRYVVKWVKQHRPDLVILADAAEQVRNAQRPGLHAMPSDPTAFAQAGLEGMLSGLVSNSAVAVLQPPPNTEYLVDCVSRFGGPSDCVTAPSSQWREQTAGEHAAVAASPNSSYIDTEQWFCVDDRCPAFVGTTPVTLDGTHLTPAYAEELAVLMRKALLG